MLETAQALVDLLDGLNSFLYIMFPCTVACLLVAFTIMLAYKNMTFFGDYRYNYISQIHREAFDMLYHGLSREEILKKLREMKFSFDIYPTEKKKYQEYANFARTVLKSDDLMLKYVVVPTFSKKEFKALKKEMQSYEIEDGDDKLIVVSLRSILQDESQENIARMSTFLKEWHTYPLLSSKISGEKTVKGENVSSIFDVLRRIGIIKETTSYVEYLECLAALRKKFPEMMIVKNKSGLTYHLQRIDPNSPAFKELEKHIKEALNEE